MKILAIVALLCGLAGSGASAYSVIETKPNYDYSQRTADAPERNPKMAALNQEILGNYSKALGRQVVGSWAAGLLALVLGIVAARGGAKKLGIAAIVLGLAGAGAAFAVMPQPLVL